MDITKPKLSTEEQVQHLVAKGVKFTVVSEEDATNYLRQNNNYFKLTAYRKNFPKHYGGSSNGKYHNLEFAQLQDLAIIDMRLRYLLMHMALDIEHYTKVLIIQLIENAQGEDGYSIVAAFTSSLDPESEKRLKDEIRRNKTNAYCGGIVQKHDNNYPVWAFVEIIPFARLVNFCWFCSDRLGHRRLRKLHFLLLPIRAVRNAAAHNNCILNDLSSSGSNTEKTEAADQEVTRALGLVGTISRDTISSKMRNIRIQQVVTLLYVHKALVSSLGVRSNRNKEINDFTKRMLRNLDYYKDNDTITSTFIFLQRIVDNWFPVDVQ